jgi:ATP-binding cassette subfamily F protein uup
VLIARLMLKPADLLLLDEPTNDLDIPSLEVLEQSLAEFPGALVLVTHDRYLLDRVSRQILALDGKGNAAYFADLSQWEAYREEVRAKGGSKEVEAPKPVVPVVKAKSSKSLSLKEEKEFKEMETKLHAAEDMLKAAKAKLEDPKIAADVSELLKRQQAVDTEQSKVEALYQRWQELEAKRNKVEVG